MCIRDRNVRTIADLREGMILPGIVGNITNFGAFVDIGIKENGLVPVSYTHLDVYKRQVQSHLINLIHEERTAVCHADNRNLFPLRLGDVYGIKMCIRDRY